MKESSLKRIFFTDSEQSREGLNPCQCLLLSRFVTAPILTWSQSEIQERSCVFFKKNDSELFEV